MDSTPSSLPDLDSYRPYLKLLVRGQIPPSMQSRLDASDIVQETLLEAYRKRQQFQGDGNAGQLASWLRQLLSCNLIDAIRTQQRAQRDVRREQNLRQSLEESAQGLENMLIADDSSPSQKVDNQFQAIRLAAAIEQLPSTQRDAILLRYFQRASLEQIAEQLQTTKTAAAGLLKRGLTKLRERLQEDTSA